MSDKRQIRLAGLMAPAFWPVHRQVKEGTVRELVLQGGRGSCKSSYASLELVLWLLAHPRCHGAALRKVGRTLRGSVYTQLCWAVDMLGLAGRFSRTTSPMELTYLPTGQKILCLGMDDAGKLKSLKPPFGYIGAVWFEELDQFDGPGQVRSAEQSLLRGGEEFLTIKSFNPPASARSWANRYALESREGKLVHHSDYRSVPPEWLGPRFLADAEHLQAVDPTAYRHEYLGEAVGSGTQVFTNLRLEPIPADVRAGFERLLHGVDWGWYPDPWAYNGCSYDAARRILYIYDEATRHRASNAETAALLLEKEVCADPEREEWLTADSAEEKSCGDYRAAGLPCRRAEKGPGSVRAGMKWLQSLACIWIDPAACPDTAREFGEYEYQRDKSGQILEGYPDENNHHIDAVRYATNRIWKRRGS